MTTVGRNKERSSYEEKRVVRGKKELESSIPAPALIPLSKYQTPPSNYRPDNGRQVPV